MQFLSLYMALCHIFPGDIHGTVPDANPVSIYGADLGAILDVYWEDIMGVIWDVILDTNWDAN